jgi:hypothetical protein
MTETEPRATAQVQICVYERRSLLSLYEETLSSLFSGAWSYTFAFAAGADLIKQRIGTSRERLVASLAEAVRAGINRFEVVGKSSVSAHKTVRVSCELSPLNVDWHRLEDIQAGAPVSRQAQRLIWSFQSRESYVKINRIKRDPVFISIETAYAGAKTPLNSRQLLQDTGPIIQAVGNAQEENYIGFVDAPPVVSVVDALGGQPNKSSRLDSHFDRAHLIVFGPRQMIDAYAAAVRASEPKVAFTTDSLGAAALIAFKDVAQLSNRVPEWHP